MSTRTATAGEALFARYAYPPNTLGYCGTGDGSELLEFATGPSNGDVRTSARHFDGAWPYLEIIAWANGIIDPLDEQVVEAYWIGNSMLDAVDAAMFVTQVKDHFSSQRGADWQCLDSSPTPAAHHSFHVFGIYPWMGLLRAGRGSPALEVLDQCRISCGEVVNVEDDFAEIRCQRLAFDGLRLVRDRQSINRYRWRKDVQSLSGPVAIGDWVSMHWEWVCQTLTESQVRELEHYTERQLDATNASIATR